MKKNTGNIMINKEDFLSSLSSNGRSYQFYSLPKLEQIFPQLKRLPKTLKILLENILRNSEKTPESWEKIKALATWTDHKNSTEILYHPTRALMQDMTGVPALADLAAMRDKVKEQGKDPQKINPIKPVDLVIDHSAMVDFFGSPEAFEKNQSLEFERNGERYSFLKWGQQAFKNLRIIPPGMGICHQINLEYLSRVVWEEHSFLFPDTVVGMDSHTPMVSGLGVLAWGVGGIEAEAAMLGQPISIRIPEVIGFHLEGQIEEGITATDLVLHITEILREKNVVGKFVEFFGPGVQALSLADRATISNMSPEFGATCAFFPVDEETLNYLALTGREETHIDLVKEYTTHQGLWSSERKERPLFSEEISLNLSKIDPSLAGPKRPQDRVPLKDLKESFEKDHSKQTLEKRWDIKEKGFALGNGDVVIAAITSCTNTSNPAVMVAAGLLAKKALEKGLSVPPWVKTSLAPGSQIVSDYLSQSGLQPSLDSLGFHLVGYGCTTCIGNSGPLDSAISTCIEKNDLNVASILSGNRNFEGRINPHVQSSYLASPPLVVAYALAGTVRINLIKDPLGYDAQKHPVFLRNIWPKNHEIQEVIEKFVSRDLFINRYKVIQDGNDLWQKLPTNEGITYPWKENSTYIKKPPFFDAPTTTTQAGCLPLHKGRILALFGDSITTDHISPAGAIPSDSPAGQYLKSHGITQREFNSYGSRRGNHEVMVRGGFANTRLVNHIKSEKTTGYTKFFSINGEETSLPLFDAAEHYKQQKTPLILMAGEEYGTGSSRDWAAKAPQLLGVKSIIAQSFERIHRSNLIGMGILPLEFTKSQSWKSLGIKGNELISLHLPKGEVLKPNAPIQLIITPPNQGPIETRLRCRIDTQKELEYYLCGGILPYVLRTLS